MDRNPSTFAIVRRAAPVACMAAIVFAAGCAAPTPATPREALANTAARIDAVLAASRDTPTRTARTMPPLPANTDAPLRFWYYAHPLMANAFRGGAVRANGVDANAEYIGEWPVAIQKLMTSFVADDLPDVGMVKRGLVAKLYDAGRIRALDSVLPKSLLDDFRAEVVADCTYGGHLIALPADGFCSALWYNTQTIGNTPPATWLHLSAIVNADDTSPVQGPSNGLGAFPFLESLWSAGGDVLADGACTLDRAPAHRALDFVLHVTRGAPRSESAAFTQWAGGRLAMTVASSARLPAAARSGIAFGVAPVPGETGPISRRSDDVVVVFSREQGAGAADIATFLDWLTGPEVMGEHAAEAGSVPLRNSTRTIESRIPGVAAAYAAGRSTPLHADWSAIESELERGIAEAYDAIERDRHTTPPAPK